MNLHWKYDYGPNSDSVNLYYGPFYIGLVSRSITENWIHVIPVTHPQYDWYLKHSDRPFRVHLMNDEDGNQFGRYASRQEAMATAIIEAEKLIKEYDVSSTIS
jgi:hypothetical protein